MSLKSKAANALKKYKNISAPAKSGIWYTIGSFLSKTVVFLTLPIFTRLMTTSEYGVVTVYQSWVDILQIFCCLYLYYYAFYNGMMKFEDDRDGYTSALQGLTSTLTLGIFAVFFIFSDFIQPVLQLPKELIYVLFLGIFFDSAFQLWAARQRYDFKYRGTVAVTFLYSALNPLLGIVAVLCLPNKAEARIFSMVALQVLLYIGIYIYNLVKGKKFFNAKYWAYALKFSIPLIPHFLASRMLSQSDRLMIDRMAGRDRAALYGIAYIVGTVILTINDSVFKAFTPWTYQKLKAKEYGDIRKSAMNLLYLMAGIIFMVIALAPELIYIVGGSAYKEAVWCVAPVALSCIMCSISNLFGNIEYYHGENYFVMFASVGSAIANVILNIIFISMFGYIAAAYTTIICYILNSVGHYFFMKKTMKKHGIQEDVYDISHIVKFVGGFCIFGLIFQFTYSYVWLRMVVLGVMALVCFKQRKKIITIMRTIKG